MPGSADNHDSRLMSGLTRNNVIILSLLLILAVVLLLAETLTAVVTLLAVTLVLSYLLIAPVTAMAHIIPHSLFGGRWLLSDRIRRTLAILLVYALFGLLLAVGVWRLLPPLVGQVRDFAGDLPSYVEQIDTSVPRSAPSPESAEPEVSAEKPLEPESLSELLQRIWVIPEEDSETPVRRSYLASRAVRNPEISDSEITEATTRLVLRKLADIIELYASRIGAYLLNLGTSALMTLVYALTALVMVFYLLHDGPTLRKGLLELLPMRGREGAALILERIHRQFLGFTKGQVVVSLMSGGLMYLLLSLLQVKYPLLLAFTYGVFSILPVIGPWFGLVPIALVVLFSDTPVNFIHVLVYSGLFYLLKVLWLWPRLIRPEYNIHPVVFILTFLLCLKVVGYAGILLSFPLASLIASLAGALRGGDSRAAKP